MILVWGTWRVGAGGDPGAYEHAEIATHLARGEGFLFSFYGPAAPTSQQAPATSWMLAGCFVLLGEGSPHAYLAAELINVLLAAAAAVGVWDLGRRLWNARVGIAAAALFAAYPALVYAATRVQAVTWATAFLALGSAAGARAVGGRDARWAAAAGGLLGLGGLGEPLLLAPAAALGGALLIKRQWRGAVAMAVVLVAGLLPWTLRNAAVHGRLMPVKSTFWYVFWQGNNAAASGTDKLAVEPDVARQLAWRISLKGLEKEMEAARKAAVSVDTAMPRELLADVEAQPTELTRMAVFRREILRQLREHPGHYLRMCALRLGQMLWFDNTNPRSLVMAYRVPYLVLAALAAGGLWIGWRQGSPHGAWAGWGGGGGGWVVLMMAGALLAVHVLVIASARFRLPLEALMTVPAAAMLVATWEKFRRRARTDG
jgi:4-amino-4-deoxy-L-arabinose transferase-like glycosyltransferase